MANVFGALNRFIARLDSEPQAPSSQRSTGSHNPGWGFQVLRNSNPSLPLEPYFDFITSINGHAIDNPDPTLFSTEIRNCAGATISLSVFSAKGSSLREHYISVPAETSSLGLSLQWSPLSSTEDVWHILDTMPNSPADVAGLLPYGDYILGSPDGLLRPGEAGLSAIVEEFLEQPLRLWVYNHEYDVTRLVTITPSRNWGGEGALGCVLGFGALHRIPAPLGEPAQGPGETLFESGPEPAKTAPTETLGHSAEFVIPAEMPLTSPPPPSTASPGNAGAAAGPPPPPSGRAKKARAHHTIVPAAGLDDYFAEGEKKSREVDNAPSTKTNAGLPPPPKAGGPPPKAAAPVPEG